MAWEKDPWVIDGAEHGADLARVFAYAATSGAEGVVDVNDCKVKETSVPSGSVTVNFGVITVLNRSASVFGQAYIAHMLTDQTIAINPTGGGGGRSDLVVVRIEDPQYAPWIPPVDYSSANFVFTRVIQDVPSDTVQYSDLGIDQSAYALARIDIPPSTATITQEMIVDLREVARPRQLRIIRSLTPPDDITIDDTAYITVAEWEDVLIPSWANHVAIIGHLSGLRTQLVGKFQFRARLGDDVATAATGIDSAAAGSRVSGVTAAEEHVPNDMTGTLQTLVVEARQSVGETGELLADDSATLVVILDFTEFAF